MRVRSGKSLLVLSIVTRFGVLALLCFLAWMTEYVNLKIAYNHPRLVELSSGKAVRIGYEITEKFFGWFGDPLEVAQTNGGMTWSIRIMGVPFTDPIAALSVMAKNHRLETGFALGLIVPLTLALLFGRVFCAYVCPASLLFFTIARIRRVLNRWFLFPELSINRGFAWGIMLGGLAVAVMLGHGIWSLILPYFAIGQTIFHGIAMGTLSLALGSVVVFSLLDLLLGRQFTCRYVCPTGRLLGFIGRKSVFAIQRDAPACLEGCNSCAEVCPMKVSPRLDETVDCSMCGECLVICPTKCLSIGVRKRPDSSHVCENVDGESALLPKQLRGLQTDEKSKFSQTWLRGHHRSSDIPVSSGRVKQTGMSALLALVFLLPVAAQAHHFKGLPHYNYFENYPQIPEEEFLGQAGEYEMSLVVYDFQGINRENVETPDNVRLFLVIFNLLNNKVYQGELTMEILDRGQPVHTVRFESAELENLYSVHRELPDAGRYALRVTLHDQGDEQVDIPFRLSSQKIHWGKWIGAGLLVLIGVAAVGARKARVAKDRKEAHQRAVKKEAPSAAQ